MYSLKNVLDKNPVQVSGAVMTLVNLPILSGQWEPKPEFVSGINTALIAVLGLFIVSKTVNTAKMEEINAEVKAVGETERTAGFEDAVALATVIEETTKGKVAEALAQVAEPPPPPRVTKKAAKKAVKKAAR